MERCPSWPKEHDWKSCNRSKPVRGFESLALRQKSPEWRVIARNSGLSLVKRRYGEILEKYKALRAEQDQDQSSTESRVADCNPALFMPIFRLCLWEYILYRTGSVRFGKGVSNDKTQCRDGKQQRTEPGVRTPAAEPPAVCRRYRRKWSRHQRRGGSGQHRRRSL